MPNKKLSVKLQKKAQAITLMMGERSVPLTAGAAGVAAFKLVGGSYGRTINPFESTDKKIRAINRYDIRNFKDGFIGAKALAKLGVQPA